MPEVKYSLKEPSRSTLDRMIEVQLYILYESLRKLFPYSVDPMYEFIENFAKMANLNPDERSRVMSVMQRFEYQGYRPTKTEIVITVMHLGMSIRNLCVTNGLMSSRTFYDKLKEYINEGEYDLAPMYDNDTLAAIKVFMNVYASLISATKELRVSA